ncbi:ferredoxin family protein [Clostridium sp. WILCCON 0269]|uniref:Ferredoxin family protein n=1 Tax=Candidatus Clostridium eludens TaxID=3381663 RepID=A0ABW8SH06_9CLOT
MSIKIHREKCIGCLKCMEVCPGSLIYKDQQGRAYIKYEKNCWGCAACIKECVSRAIKYYLASDIGGNGSCLYVEQNADELKWHIVDEEHNESILSTKRKEANKY